ncbi:hypothetical protein [Metaclostridioides mangenotii]|uniref:hypothetical protein n=1 Tax=Metaclostridioides mangenotii TaxID=1540 RepID=UPI000464B96F|nr:hypothetical protein [Clostridioides mangenotii]
MKDTKYIDNYFKILSLAFWPIIWYKWIVISNEIIEISLVTIYSILCVIYTFHFIYLKTKCNYEIDKIEVYYNFSTILAFISTLYSFLIFPKNLTFLYLKIALICAYFYFSVLKAIRYKREEGIVGIMGSLLLAVITVFY